MLIIGIAGSISVKIILMIRKLKNKGGDLEVHSPAPTHRDRNYYDTQSASIH